jgi:hypothetical protein
MRSYLTCFTGTKVQILTLLRQPSEVLIGDALSRRRRFFAQQVTKPVCY